MKKIFLFISMAALSYSCTKNSMQLNSYEKGKQEGYHANEANRLLNANEKNKKANTKAAAKQKEQQSQQLNAINNTKHKKANTNTGVFKFY